MKKLNIIIATATRNRPKMLVFLYQSLSTLDISPEINVGFLIVENNKSSTSDRWLSEIRSQIRFSSVTYLLETTIGISHARNRALDYAQKAGADFLVFVDDDEFVESDWLRKLLAEQQAMDLDIVGSPVRAVPQQKRLNLWQRFIWSGIKGIGTKSEQRAKEKWQENNAHTIKIATGSWLGRVDFFRKTGLRFDPDLGLTGGEDWQLWAEAKKLGAKTGWAPEAIVYETVPCCRISFSYYFRRTRDHDMTKLAILCRENPRQALMRLPFKFLSRFWKIIYTACSLPFRRGQALVSLAMAFGGFVGLLMAACGKQSLHYSETTGS